MNHHTDAGQSGSGSAGARSSQKEACSVTSSDGCSAALNVASKATLHDVGVAYAIACSKVLAALTPFINGERCAQRMAVAGWTTQWMITVRGTTGNDTDRKDC